MSFHYSLERMKTAAILRMKGRFLEESTDGGMLEEIEELLGVGCSHFIVNLEKVDYLNSSGINIFVRLVTRIGQSGGTLIFASAPERIRTLLDVMKLNAVFDIVESESAARSQLNL